MVEQVCTENPARGMFVRAGQARSLLSQREKAPPYGITSVTISRLLVAIDTHLAADEAAVVARMVPWRTVIASDVADAFTRPWAISFGVSGMLAEPALAVVPLVVRLLGGRTSEAVLGVVCIRPPAPGKSWQSSHGGCERHHKQSRHHNDPNASQGLPPPHLSMGGWTGQPPPSCRTIVVKIT
jgi:hypothetical protein